MRFRHRLAMALVGLLAFVLLPWSSSEAGRPVYLSDYLQGNEGDVWIYSAGNLADLDIPVTLDYADAGFREYSYIKGTYGSETFTPGENEVEATFLSCEVSGDLITIYEWIDYDLDSGCMISDRQPNAKIIDLGDSQYVLQMFYIRQPWLPELVEDDHHLHVNVLDTLQPTGDRKLPCEHANEFRFSPSVGLVAFQIGEGDWTDPNVEKYTFKKDIPMETPQTIYCAS